MRNSLLAAAVSLVLCGAVHAEGTFISLQTPSLYLSKVSGNGDYAVGSVPFTAGVRWTAATGEEEWLPNMVDAIGINNYGTISGALGEDGGSFEGGRDLGAIAKVGSDPELLTGTLDSNSSGFDIADDGTVVGLSFSDDSSVARAFTWNAATGMTALPVARPDEYSRADVISDDGRVIAGWNDGPDGRSNVIWIDRVPMVLTESSGYEIGAATGVSNNGKFVVGGDIMNDDGEFGVWRWSEKEGLTFIPGMGYAFGVTNDGKTVIGNTDFFDFVPRAAMIWREGKGTIQLSQYLLEQGIEVPDGWDPDLAGGFGGISNDGTTMSGFAYGPIGDIQSFIIRIERTDSGDDAIFADGFEAAPN